jgi:hypothetical protein
VHPSRDEKTSLPLGKRTSNRAHLTTPAKTNNRARLIPHQKTLAVKIKVTALQMRVRNQEGMRFSRCHGLREVREGDND